MLQRAASNAYSWWWASHIRTKQSKWMEQNLQDMEEKVQAVVKLIEEDGDSFAKRAEMYYKKRPELIHFVEESYRAYRALAERYDHISTELQNANNTIASVFPEQVQFMEDEEYDAPPRFPKKPPESSKGNIPKVPKVPKDVNSTFASAAKKFETKKSMKVTNSAKVAKSGLSKSKGRQEIDRIQKEILALQTEKEFVKSSYECGLAKYWEIDEKIKEMQDKVSSLQDEFGAGIVIEDEEARQLMASAALKSCQETLAKLEEKQEKSTEEAVIERKRINAAREKLESLRDGLLHGEITQEKPKSKDKSSKAVTELKISDKESSTVTQERKDLELLRVTIKEHFEVESNASLSVTELAEKIDDLVNKVISLEAAVSSQTALIQRLREETDELHAQIGTLEDDKATLINGKNNLRDKLKEMEEKLLRLNELNRIVEDQNDSLQTHFTEAHCNLDHISEKLHDVKPDDEHQARPQTEQRSLVEVESQQEDRRQEGVQNSNDGLHEPQEVNSEEESKVLDKQHEDVRRQEEGAQNSNEGLHELQKINSEEESKVLDKQHKDARRQEEGAQNSNDSLHELQKINSEGESKVLDKQHEDVRRQEEGAQNSNDGLHELQKINSEEESKVLNKQHEDVGRQEEGALNAEDDLHEPQKLKSKEEDKVSAKPHKTLRRQEFALDLDDSSCVSHEEIKRKEGALHVNDELHEPQKLNSEEQKVSVKGKPQKKLIRQAVSLNLDDSPNESHEEVKRQEGAGALNANDDLHEPQKLNSEEEQKFSGKRRKKLRRQAVALNLDDILNESLNMEPKKELKIPASLQKEKKFSAEVNAQADLEDREEKEELNVSQSMQKEEGVYAEVSLQADFKGQEQKLNPEVLKDSDRSPEESREQGSVLSPDGSLDESQKGKPDEKIEVSVSSQKEKATGEKKEEEEIKHLSNSSKNLREHASLPQTSNEPDASLVKSHDMNMEENFDKQDSTKAGDNLLAGTLKDATEQDDEPDWKHLFMNGMENREKVLLSEYTSVLRNYKEMKKKLGELENKNEEGLFDILAQLKELRSDNAKKDDQIKILRQKLSLLQTGLDENESEKSTLTEYQKIEREIIYDVKVVMAEEPEISPIEQKFRMSIDELLEENLEFWFRFSSTLYQIQKFETEIKDLESESLKLEEKRKMQDGSTNAKFSLKSDAKPLYKHLKEIHIELGVWLEKSVLLKDELKSRFSSLCDIQEEITAALKESAEDDDFKFTSYQAAKFQGEILNMKQENNKVADELQAGLDHVTTLQLEVERDMANLNEEFNLAGSKNRQNVQLDHSDSRSRVPLRSFIFGTKPKKQKHSIFSCVHPALQKKYNGLKAGY